jgi:quinol monooxygenase YgiN
MYARSTTFRGDPSALDDLIAYVRDKTLPAVRQMDGCLGLSLLVDRHTGGCIATTSWTDADAMHRSADAMRSIRDTALHGARRPTSRSGRSTSCTAGTSRPRALPPASSAPADRPDHSPR